MKNILIQFSIAKMNSQQYDQVITDLEAAGKGNIPERVFHVAAPHGDGWHVTDVWTSEEAFNDFAEVMVPTLVKNGVEPAEPFILPVHNIILPQ
jgi:hypothetical protein